VKLQEDDNEEDEELEEDPLLEALDFFFSAFLLMV